MFELADLEKEILSFHPQANCSLITKAYYFAKEHHKDQRRVSQHPYLTHLLATAQILTTLHMDDETIAAALLHDIIEDTDVKTEEIKAEFGPDIAALVEGVTKLSRLQYKTSEEHLAENLRKMFMAMAKDVRVLLIKLADRLHNMRTLEFLSQEKQHRISQETLEIYAPLAHRLGIGVIKMELEDLALRYLEPEAFLKIGEWLKESRQACDEYIQRYVEPLGKQLAKVNIEGEISGRPKHFYSIFQKMKRKNVEIEKIYDLMAIRVITKDVKDCYGALGIIHTMWKPMPGRFKDYIAVPKPNMYQSLHTTVFGQEGEPVEFQIRSQEMHQVAEEGIAAHWWYKEKSAGKNLLAEAEKFSWLRHLIELKDPGEFMESLKINLYEDQVFVFTPKGDVKELPRGSTPVDLAYAIHTDVGNKCVGAKVNDKIVPLRYILVNGDIVSIITSKHNKPNRDWLKFVKTNKARSRIRAFLRQEERDTCVQIGRELLEAELKKRGLNQAEFLKQDKLQEIAQKLELASADDLLADVGYNRLPAIRIVRLLCPAIEDTKTIPETKLASPKTGIHVAGLGDDVMLRLSKCCSPVPGDKIIGFITHGRGVSIHRANCPNTVNFDPRSMVDVSWYSEKKSAYEVSIEAEAFDRSNLLADILKVISEEKITINSASAWATKNKMAKCHFLVEIKDTAQLEDLLIKIKQVKNVVAANRTNP